MKHWALWPVFLFCALWGRGLGGGYFTWCTGWPTTLGRRTIAFGSASRWRAASLARNKSLAPISIVLAQLRAQLYSLFMGADRRNPKQEHNAPNGLC